MELKLRPGEVSVILPILIIVPYGIEIDVQELLRAGDGEAYNRTIWN